MSTTIATRPLGRHDATSQHAPDPIYPAAAEFPLGRPFGVVTPDAGTPSGPATRPFGLRYASTSTSAATADTATLGYDEQRQIGIAHDGNAWVPLMRHTTGATTTATSDSHRGPDSDADHTED